MQCELGLTTPISVVQYHSDLMATQKIFADINVPGLYLYKTGWVQSPPYTTPLPYKLRYCKKTRNGIGQYSDTALSLAHLQGGFAFPYVSSAYVKAYDRLISQVKSAYSVNLGETLGEGRKAFGMIATRVTQLSNAYSNLRKGNVAGMLREFGYRRKRRAKTWVRVGRKGKVHSIKTEQVRISESDLKRRVKSPAQVWLEYHLGWSPILSEIYNSLEQKNEVHPLTFNKRLKASGSATWAEFTTSTRPFGWDGTTITEPVRFENVYKVRLACTVTVKEPLKKKFADNGIVNPVLIAWNLTPMTMFIDWFIPVSSYLNGFTAFYGCEIRDIIRTDRRYATREYGDFYSTSRYKSVSVVEKAYLFERQVSLGVSELQVPTLSSRMGKGISSATRAATAVSVLINMLGK